MKQFITTLVLLSCITALIGCKASSSLTQDVPKTASNNSPSAESPAIPPADTFEITGTIVYKSLEGGFFAIHGDDGNKYDPINLPESFRKDGLKVKVSARHKTDAMSMHMYGTIIDIVEIAVK